jgi:type IV pilus assembly protein PilN
MIKVNLLATVPGATPPREWLPAGQRSAILGLGLLLTTAIGVGSWWFYLNHTKSTITARIGAAQTELVRLKEAAKLVEATTQRKSELTERLALIERLRAAKRGPVSLLDTLSRNLTEGTWLLEVKQTGTAIQIDGRAMSLSAVTDFAAGLQASGLFLHPVEILTTAAETVEDTPVVKFSMKAEPVPPAQPPTPASTAPSNSTATAAPAVMPGKAGA